MKTILTSLICLVIAVTSSYAQEAGKLDPVGTWKLQQYRGSRLMSPEGSTIRLDKNGSYVVMDAQGKNLEAGGKGKWSIEGNVITRLQDRYVGRPPERWQVVKRSADAITIELQASTPPASKDDLSTEVWTRTAPVEVGIEATPAQKEEDFTHSVKDNAVIITGYRGAGGAVTIPEKIAGLPVREIGKFAFATGNNPLPKIASAIIPASVTKLGTSAGDGPFSDCPKLLSITVAGDNPAFRSVDGVLFNKNGTTLIQYPGGKSGSYAIPDGVTQIGHNAFLRCSGLTSVTIPADVITIDVEAFGECTKLNAVTIPASVTNIGDFAFVKCNGLDAAIFEGNAPSQVGRQAFRDTAPNFTIRYQKGSTGFTSPQWKGYPAVEIDPAANQSTGMLSWYSSDGRVIKAKFIKLDGKAVVVEKEDGTRHTIPFAKLAPAGLEQAKRLANRVNPASTPK